MAWAKEADLSTKRSINKWQEKQKSNDMAIEIQCGRLSLYNTREVNHGIRTPEKRGKENERSRKDGLSHRSFFLMRSELNAMSLVFERSFAFRSL